MTAAPAPDVTDRTGATDEEFAARLRAFDGEAAPESFDAIAALRRVEALADHWERAADEWESTLRDWQTASRAQVRRMRAAAADLRRALAPQPADAEGTRR